MMKINKISQSLALIPLTGMVFLMGTPSAFASECSVLSPCVVTSVPAVSSLTDALASTEIRVTAPSVDSVTAPVAEKVDNVTAPVAGAVSKATAPAVSVIETATAPITPFLPVLPEPVKITPAKPATAAQEPASSVAPNTVAAEGANTDNVTPENTMSASTTSDSGQSHESPAAVSGGLDESTTLAPNASDAKPAVVHSAQGSTTKIINSGGFGFGSLNPVDDPVGFTSLVFAYIIVLGSAIGFAIKRSAFLNFG